MDWPSELDISDPTHTHMHALQAHSESYVLKDSLHNLEARYSRILLKYVYDLLFFLVTLQLNCPKPCHSRRMANQPVSHHKKESHAWNVSSYLPACAFSPESNNSLKLIACKVLVFRRQEVSLPVTWNWST